MKILYIILVSTLLVCCDYLKESLIWYEPNKAKVITQFGYDRTKSQALLMLTDTFNRLEQLFKVPQKWEEIAKIENNYYKDLYKEYGGNKEMRIYYFASDPEEMYLVQYIDQIFIVEFYNDTCTINNWYSGEDISEQEIKRIKERYKREVLNVLLEKGEKLGIPDSMLYEN